MKIQLTKGMETIVDDSDFEYLGKFKWYAMKNKTGQWYACRREAKTNKFMFMHRIILDAPDDLQVDHINRDSLDNRRCNLRLCTATQNRGNQAKRRNSDVPLKGVAIKRITKRGHIRFFSQIQCSGVKYHLGTFDSMIDAAIAYDKKAKELFGEFALVNFPEEL